MENEGVTPQPEKKKDKFDPKSTDSLFRMLSSSHYNLLRMVDRKAAIILTVNSILITLLYGAMRITSGVEQEEVEIFITSLLSFCSISMMFALLGMLPHKYSGKKFRKADIKEASMPVILQTCRWLNSKQR